MSKLTVSKIRSFSGTISFNIERRYSSAIVSIPDNELVFINQELRHL